MNKGVNMKYTQKELEAMSDFELNASVAELFLPCDYIVNEKDKVVELANYKDVMVGGMHDQVLSPYAEFNPCKNWGCCGFLIDYLRVIAGATIEFDDSIFLFHHRKNKIAVRCKNTKRATAIVYILVKQDNE